MARNWIPPRIPAPPKLRSFFGRPRIYEYGIALLVVPGGLANACRAFYAGEYLPTCLWLTTAVGVFFFTVLKIWAQSAGQEVERSGRELEGCLFVLHSILTEDTVHLDGQVRLALHVPVDEGQFLQQVTPYAGEPGSESKVGRKFKVQSGIIGKAYRERQAQIADRFSDDPEEIVRELMTSWNYSERDAMDQAQGVGWPSPSSWWRMLAPFTAFSIAMRPRGSILPKPARGSSSTGVLGLRGLLA